MWLLRDAFSAMAAARKVAADLKLPGGCIHGWGSPWRKRRTGMTLDRLIRLSSSSPVSLQKQRAWLPKGESHALRGGPAQGCYAVIDARR